ncbi:uncharacterized protein [Prorops nasuta]|uniref:uncharacterized protein n=1 Tax=Prorops nasuta TaxID=863751 RepID=UPI0034CEB979
MPNCCIAPGCTSGYRSNNQKVHLFSVPADLILRQKWQIAMCRKDVIIKNGQRLCEKHFAVKDILWKKVLLDTDGKIIGESPYKQPQLRRGAIPTHFLWNEEREREKLRHIWGLLKMISIMKILIKII